MKRLIELTADDLRRNPVWRYEGGNGPDALVEAAGRDSLSQQDDEIFLAATEFRLSDGSDLFGFCFPADDSGLDYLQPAILTDSGPVNFWFDGPAPPEFLVRQWKALGREEKQVFPVSFRCLVPVDGRMVTGRIEAVESSRDLSAGPPAPEIGEDAAAAAAAAENAGRVPTARPTQARRNTGPVEKRTARRRKAEMTVEFSQGALRGTGTTHDVSPRGMFVRSPRLPGTGPMLRLKVNLPGGRTLVLQGRVVREAESSPGFGLRLAEEWPQYQDLFPKGPRKPK